MAEPLSPERLDEITEQAAQVVGTFGDDWYLVYDPDADEVSARTDEGAPPFEGGYTPIFETTQWPEDAPRSPLAEFLVSSIVVVPELLGEVDRLRAELDELRKAKTAYINGDDGYLSLRCNNCDGLIDFIEAGDDFDRLDAERRGHVCGGGS